MSGATEPPPTMAATSPAIPPTAAGPPRPEWAGPYPQGLTQRARDEIGGATRRERHQQPDRPRRIGLARRGAREHRERGRERETDQSGHNDTHHAVFPGPRRRRPVILPHAGARRQPKSHVP